MLRVEMVPLDKEWLLQHRLRELVLYQIYHLELQIELFRFGIITPLFLPLHRMLRLLTVEMRNTIPLVFI